MNKENWFFINRNNFTIKLIVVFTIFLIINNAVIAISSTGFLNEPSQEERSSSSIIERQNEYPIDYTVIDHYANGSDVIRGTANSMDEPLPSWKVDDEYRQPLSKNRTALWGSEEIAVVANNFWYDFHNDPEDYNTKTDAQHLYYYEDISMDLKNSDPYINMYSDLFINRTEVSDGGIDIVSETATGDFDGNFREDLVIVTREAQELTVRVMENWGGLGFKMMAESVLGTSETIPMILADDLDGDGVDEFVIFGEDLSQPKVWIFDDLANSGSKEPVYYNDKIMLRVHTAPDRYIYTESFDGTNVKQIDETSVPGDVEFTILKSSNTSYDGPVLYGDQVMLKDHNGEYLQSSLAGYYIISGEINPLSPNSSIFTISGDLELTKRTGAAYYNSHISLKDFNGYFVSNIASLHDIAYYLDLEAEDTTFDTWFKIIRKTSIPETFITADITPIATLSDSSFVTRDMISRTSNTDWIYHITTKSMAIGNLDSDSEPEIVVVGMDSSGWVRAWIYDDMLNNFPEIRELTWVSSIQDVTPCVTMGDVDGDTIDELIFSFATDAFGKVEIYDDAVANYVLLGENLVLTMNYMEI